MMHWQLLFKNCQDWFYNFTNEGVITIGVNNTFMIHLDGAPAALS